MRFKFIFSYFHTLFLGHRGIVLSKSNHLPLLPLSNDYGDPVASPYLNPPKLFNLIPVAYIFIIVNLPYLFVNKFSCFRFPRIVVFALFFFSYQFLLDSK